MSPPEVKAISARSGEIAGSAKRKEAVCVFELCADATRLRVAVGSMSESVRVMANSFIKRLMMNLLEEPLLFWE
jgi:hypothetical protein